MRILIPVAQLVEQYICDFCGHGNEPDNHLASVEFIIRPDHLHVMIFDDFHHDWILHKHCASAMTAEVQFSLTHTFDRFQAILMRHHGQHPGS